MRALILVALVATTGCRGWTSEKPPVHLNPNMDTQEKLKPYRKSDFFPDGRAMRPIPEGTVARGMRHVDDVFARSQDELFMTGGVGGAPTNAAPAQIVVDENTLRRGHERYDIYCAPCHDRAGDGQGTVAARLAIKPPSFHDPRIKTMPLGKIFQAMTNGVNPPNMPSYAVQVSPEDRWAIALYIRALEKAKDPAYDPAMVANPNPPAPPAPAPVK